MSVIKPIAFYLPQFYPTPENDVWWEPGFTEWTNVVKARPLFRGHRQPRIPQELSFYDLRVPEVRERQVELAKEAGLYGFCYWHYWFGGGKRLLHRVFDEVVKLGKPDFPFCLCWANHSWYAKTWDPSSKDRLLIEQSYPSEQDFIEHFNTMLPAFQDERYIRVGGKLLFGVFAPYAIPDPVRFKEIWNELAQKNGLGGFSFFGFVQGENQLSRLPQDVYDIVVYDALSDSVPTRNLLISKTLDIFHRPLHKIHYDDYINKAINAFNLHASFIPCIDPDFDHSPRSANRGVIIQDSSPQKWGILCKKVKAIVEARNNFDNIVFIKAWNEWGEGNYMEPDTKWGKSYIVETRKNLV